MSIRDEAYQTYVKGFNCAQAVVSACGKYTGLDEKTALAVSGGFGGGARCGEICGAISGAIMAISLTNPYTDTTDTEAKAKIARLAAEYCSEFKEKFGSLRCAELKSKGICRELVGAAAEIAENIILENS